MSGLEKIQAELKAEETVRLSASLELNIETFQSFSAIELPVP